jgi:hypothetical protein
MAYANPTAGARRGDYDEVAVASLTAASGTADDTIADVGASFNQATLNNNFKDLATKLNALLVECRKAGIISS